MIIYFIFPRVECRSPSQDMNRDFKEKSLEGGWHLLKIYFVVLVLAQIWRLFSSSLSLLCHPNKAWALNEPTLTMLDVEKRK